MFGLSAVPSHMTWQTSFLFLISRCKPYILWRNVICVWLRDSENLFWDLHAIDLHRNVHQKCAQLYQEENVSQWSRHTGFSSRIGRLQCVHMTVHCIEMTKKEVLWPVAATINVADAVLNKQTRPKTIIQELSSKNPLVKASKQADLSLRLWAVMLLREEHEVVSWRHHDAISWHADSR